MTLSIEQSEEHKTLIRTGDTILSRIQKKADEEQNYQFEEDWKETLVCVKECMDTYDSLHSLYRLCNYGFMDSDNPWYIARDIIGEELVKVPGQPMPGTLNDPSFDIKA